MLLDRLRGSLGASLTALGASFGVLGRVLGALRELLGTSSAQETLDILKMNFPPRREHDFRNLYEQEREASYRGSVFFRLG